MEKINSDIINQMNQLGKQGKSFVFLIDFEMKKPVLFPFPKSTRKIWFQTPWHSNITDQKNHIHFERWKTKPVSFTHYKAGFDMVKQHIGNGDTYLLNYTQPTEVEYNHTLEDIFYQRFY